MTSLEKQSAELSSGSFSKIDRADSEGASSEVFCLENCKDKDVPFWGFNGEYKGKCTKVYDGDTCHIIFEFNNQLTKIKIRMLGYDAPEMKSKDAAIKQKATEARDKLRELVLDKIVTCKLGDFDKYGRVLCDIFTSDGLHVNRFMAKTYGIYGRQQYNLYD